MSALIEAQQLSIAFPIMNASHRSLKKHLLHAATGGRIARDQRDKVTVTAIDGIDFRLQPGERVALLGHNGSGKTTLLRALAGIYHPTGGTLRVEGAMASLLDIQLGMDPEATGTENIFLRGILMGLTRREIEQQFDQIAAFADLGDFLDLPMRTYSSGMQVRLAFAICTSVPRPILLMDEWLAVGDAGFAEKAVARLKQRVAEAQILVMATHSAGMVEAVCNRCIRLEHGRILSDRRLLPGEAA